MTYDLMAVGVLDVVCLVSGVGSVVARSDGVA